MTRPASFTAKGSRSAWRSQGLCSESDVARVDAHLKACGLPTRIQDIPGEAPSVEALMQAIGQDKKVARGKLTFILTKGIGRAFIARDVDAALVANFLSAELLS